MVATYVLFVFVATTSFHTVVLSLSMVVLLVGINKEMYDFHKNIPTKTASK